MKNLLRLLAFVLMVGGAYAQSNLPACQGSDVSKWTNCFGTQVYPLGGKYVGEWKDGVYNRQGTYTFPDGAIYIGEYKDGKWNGQGSYTSGRGIKYVGEWQDGRRSGQGTWTTLGGLKYVGEYKYDERNGLGTSYASDGTIVSQGIWAEGKFVRSAPVQQVSVTSPIVATATELPITSSSNLPACQGRETASWSNCVGSNASSDGGSYVGEWKDGKRNGQGTITYPYGG